MKETSLRDSLARAAAAGESLERLVRLTARSLLEAGHADRAALFLRSEKEAAVLEGIVVDSALPVAPETGKRLDALLPAAVEMLASRGPFQLDLREATWAATLEPLAGMKSAAILPLMCSGESLGVALVARARDPAPEALEELRAITDRLAVTVSQRRLAARSRRLEARLSALADLERMLAAGVSTETFLNRLTELARRETEASFAAVAHCAVAGNGVSFAAFEGPTEIMSRLDESGAASKWRGWSQNRRAAVENIHLLPTAGDGGATLRAQGTDMILTLPLDCEGELLGILAVGNGAKKSPPAMREALEPLATLAAKALREDSLRARTATADATLAALLESGEEMVLLLDREGTIQQDSRAAREKLGLDSARKNPSRLEEIFPATQRKEIADWRIAAAGGKTPPPLELTLPSGEILRLRVQNTLLPGGRWQVGLEDLTAARSDERQRKEWDAELAAVLDSMESGMLLFDARGGLRRANARFAHLFGLGPDALEEMADFEALLRAVRDRFREPSAVESRWREIVRRGDEAAWDELEVLHPSRRVMERFARPVMSEEGQRIGWLELYRDITAERLIQSKLMQSEKMAALGQLVSGIAHELNNPLTGIMGYAQLLLRHELEGERAVEVRRIFEEAERAGRIVKNLLLFSREKKPERRPVKVNEIIERTLALRSYELRVRNITVERDLDAELGPVLADAHQLQQVVLNLLVNAEQAMQQDRGRGRITVRTRRGSRQRMALEVGDDGPGIPPEIASRIFDPFFTTKPVGAGTGLGLSIVYGIVQEHGGEVTVETSPEHGTNFVIELPLYTGRAQETHPEPVRHAPARAGARGQKVLVIEDEPTVAQLVVDVLREEGHHAEAVLDSVEGLDRILRQHYDLIICDLRMPRLDGREIYSSLVRKGNSASHRIIFITGDTLTPDTVEFLETNSLRYLAKPFLVEELKAAVEQALERGRGGNGGGPGTRPAPPASTGEKGGGPSRLLRSSRWRQSGASAGTAGLGQSRTNAPAVRANHGSGVR